MGLTGGKKQIPPSREGFKRNLGAKTPKEMGPRNLEANFLRATRGAGFANLYSIFSPSGENPLFSRGRERNAKLLGNI